METPEILEKVSKLSPGEQEFFRGMIAQFGCTEERAFEELIRYKKKNIAYFQQEGKMEFVEHLTNELRMLES